MFIIAKLIFESYIPEQLAAGMYFKQQIKDIIYGKVYEYDRIFMLNHTPSDKDSYINANGYPIRPMIVSMTANPDKLADVLAIDPEIAWWDAEPWDDESDLRDIEVRDFNYILENEDGYVEIEVDVSIDEHGEEIVVPLLYMGKCTLRIVQDEMYEDDEDDMDWDDDLTQYDPQDYETE